MMATRKATRTTINDLNPKAADWMQRASDEFLRRHGRFRDLVMKMIASAEEIQPEGNGVGVTVVRRQHRTTEPTSADLIAAYNESPDPLPAPIIAYIVKHYVNELPRKTGPKVSTRSTWQKVMIIAFYQHQLHKANQRKTSGLLSDPATRAKARTAKKFSISIRTLESLIAPRPLLTPPPK